MKTCIFLADIKMSLTRLVKVSYIFQKEAIYQNAEVARCLQTISHQQHQKSEDGLNSA